MHNKKFNIADIQKLAIVLGGGELPISVVNSLKDKQISIFLITFDGVPINKKLTDEILFNYKFEHISDLFDLIELESIQHIVFCGQMIRPKINLELITQKSLKILKPILNSFNQGDDYLFKSILSVFKNFGIQTLNVSDLLPNLLVPEGVLTIKDPSDLDISDSDRAEIILKSISGIDIGQS
jgi:DUF1009 family protein